MPIYKDENKTSDGRCYYFKINYTANDGTYKSYKSKRYATKKEAEKDEAEYLLKIGKSATSRITFNRLCSEYIASKKSTIKLQSIKQIKLLSSYIESNIGTIEVAKFSKTQYEQFRNWIDEQEFSLTHKNNILYHLSTLMRYASIVYDINNNITKKYSRFKDSKIKKMDFFTLDEFNKFISVVDDIRYEALFTLLFYCGLREGEANALQWNDVDFEKNIITINKSVSTSYHGNNTDKYLISSPKTKSSIRNIPLTELASNRLKMLHGYYSKFVHFASNWFVFGGLNPLPHSTITSNKNRYCKLANVKQIRIHDFRHSCASFYIHLGCSPNVLARFLGHSSIKMTLDIYQHLYESDMSDIVNRANNLSNGK